MSASTNCCDDGGDFAESHDEARNSDRGCWSYVGSVIGRSVGDRNGRGAFHPGFGSRTRVGRNIDSL